MESMARQTIERARLAKFFTMLAVKERFAPRLHVKPLVAELFLTDNCNLKCISCACWRTVTRQELSTDEWKDVIAQLADVGVLKVNFTGGEPLLRSDAPEIMRYARDRGIHTMHLNTNAVLLDERRRTAVLDAGVRSFNISVDGPNAAVHEEIRGVRGSFDKTVGNLRLLLAEQKRLGLKVRMNFTVMRSNVRELPDIARLAQHLKVRLYLNLVTDHTFLFRDLQVTSESRLPMEDLDEALAELEKIVRADGSYLPRFSELAYIRKHFTDLRQGSLPCAESQLKLMVHSRGETGGCWGHDPESNVRESSLADIIDSAHYRDEHEKFFRKECVGCGSNYALNLRWRPGSYVDDMKWRLGRGSLAAAG
jgi:MoaA/NifB/PqqE/SkfB family radical SAM enzyme